MKRVLIALALVIACGPIYAQKKKSSSKGYTARKQAIQGTYLIDVEAMLGDIDMIHQYGKYVINGNNISQYSWDKRNGRWAKDFTVPYKLVYNKSSGYMHGYNIVFKSPHGEMSICTGDPNGDGKMELWWSDSVSYVKQ